MLYIYDMSYSKSGKFSEELQRVASAARLLSHPARLSILGFLSEQDSCMSGDLSKHLPISRATAAQHLKELREAGWIQGNIQGAKICYCTDVDRVKMATVELKEYVQKIHRKKSPASSCVKDVPRTESVLFLCTGNSCRSQMAEALLRNLAPQTIRSLSAGTEPAKKIHPLAVQVMEEIGISMKGMTPKSLSVFEEKETFDTVIFVCDKAEKSCPRAFSSAGAHLSWPFPDPVQVRGSQEKKLQAFRNVRDELKSQIENWIHKKG